MDYNVRSEAEAKGFGFVSDGDHDLPLEREAGFFQFVAQDFRIDGFQKAGSGGSMHLNRQADDAFCQVSMVLVCLAPGDGTL